MNKTLLTVLALSCSMTANVAAQEHKGSAPVSGATYNLYNVGTKQFLGVENARLVLGGEKVDVTLSAVNDTNTPGFFRLTSADGTWHADLYGTPSLETDKFSQWRIEPVNGKKDVYAIASRNTEASASLYLYQNEALGRLSAVPQQPSAQFEAAQWKLVYTGEDTPPLYGFDENSKTYENPGDGYWVVSITRTFQPGQWTTFCSPVNLTESQLKQLFGDDVQVAELKAQNTNELQFVTSHSLKAGVPCIIKVMKPAENNEYILEDNFTFASQAETVPVNGGTFHGTLTVTKPNFGYALNPNTSAVEPIDNGYVVDAMSAYYVSYLDVVIDRWSLDGTTGIGTITTTTPEGDIYTIGGQKVGSGKKAAKRLQHGVYVVGGKKHAKLTNLTNP